MSIRFDWKQNRISESGYYSMIEKFPKEKISDHYELFGLATYQHSKLVIIHEPSSFSTR